MARRKGGAIVLHAPDGREWEGAAAAVRAEGMTPWRRRMLADALRALRMATEPGTERRATAVARRRLEAIREAEAGRRARAEGRGTEAEPKPKAGTRGGWSGQKSAPPAKKKTARTGGRRGGRGKSRKNERKSRRNRNRKKRKKTPTPR